MCDLTNINHKAKWKEGKMLIKIYNVRHKYFYQVKYPAATDCYV
jgi:hypothetical protein